MDIQLILDPGKVAEYLCKYLCKEESNLTTCYCVMIHNIRLASLRNGMDSRATLRQAMEKLLGERVPLKKETSHLIMSLSIYVCSHNFVHVNIKNDPRRLNVKETAEKEVQPTNATTTATLAGTGNRNNKNFTVAPFKIWIDVYCKTMEPVSWIDDLTYQRYINELRDMAIRYFCCLFMVDQKGEQRNKICTHLKKILFLFSSLIIQARTILLIASTTANLG